MLVLLLVLGVAAGVSAQAQSPTFNNEVVRIFQQHCQSCHHPGDIAPFSLMDYASARPQAHSIKLAVTERRMPPWPPAPGYGDFKDARLLTPAQIDAIVRWVDAGAPEGNPADLPAPLTFTDGWTLGTPDHVASIQEYTLPSTDEIYRCFSIPLNLMQDRFVSAIGVRPGQRQVVHHVILFGDPSGASRALDDGEPGPGYTCFGGPGFDSSDEFFGGWAPGVRPAFLSPSVGMRLTAGSRLVIQVHYSPLTGGERDRTQVGIYFSRGPVDKIVRVIPVEDRSFMIPAGAARHEVSMSVLNFLGAGHIVAVAPHMHLLGREFRANVTYANGQILPLIRIDRWDFHWQGVYQYFRPISVPFGVVVDFTAIYDNSSNNPHNPNSPPRDVRWGERTTDEMSMLFLLVTLDSEHLAAPQAAAAGMVNAASFTGGATTPGAIASLFGSGFGSTWEQATALPLPRRLGGTRVSVGGVEAPLFFASPDQINFQVPFEATGSTASVVVTRSDGQSATLSLPLASAQPGIFTIGGSAAAAVNAVTGTLITATAPVARGDWVSLFVSGLGAVTPAGASGVAPSALATTLATPTVTVGNIRAEINFSGLAPGYAGLYQVNFQVPRDAPIGAEVPLKIAISGIESNTTRLAIR